ncbi:MAG: hypothetical protein ACRDTM_00555 [Micromonosporaceae bacterium]
MRAHRLLVSAAVALFLLGGCGGAAPPESEPASPSAPATTTPASGAATLTVGQSGTAAPRTIWYVRIESMAAKPLVEKGFSGTSIALNQQLEPGEYRVISWWRQCRNVCPTSGEKGLGPLEQVCGAVVNLPAGAHVTATVTIKEDGGCTVRSSAR